MPSCCSTKVYLTEIKTGPAWPAIVLESLTHVFAPRCWAWSDLLEHMTTWHGINLKFFSKLPQTDPRSSAGTVPADERIQLQARQSISLIIEINRNNKSWENMTCKAFSHVLVLTCMDRFLESRQISDTFTHVEMKGYLQHNQYQYRSKRSILRLWQELFVIGLLQIVRKHIQDILSEIVLRDDFQQTTVTLLEGQEVTRLDSTRLSSSESLRWFHTAEFLGQNVSGRLPSTRRHRIIW